MARDKKDAALGFIFVTLLIDIIGFGIIIPILPQLIQGLIHDTVSEASRYGGWLIFAYSFMQFLCSPIIGNLSDQYGRRPVLLFSLFGFGIDYLFLAFAPTIAWLFVGRLIAGVTGASITTGSAYIADISTPEKKAQNFGMIGAAFGLGFIIGPVLGGQLAHFGVRAPFIGAACLSLINWLYGYFILPESLSKENRRPFQWSRANPVGSLRMLNKYPVIAGMVISITLIYIASHSVQTTWSYYTIEKFGWSSRMVGNSLGVVGICVMIVQGLLIRKIIPKLGQEKSVYTGLALYAIGFLLFAFATQTWMMFAFTAVYCLGGIAMPAIQGIISTHVPPNEQGELQGALTSLMSATAIIGPLIMTNAFAYFTSSAAPVHFPGAPFIVSAVLTLISTVLAYKSLRK
ncbi:TCR/Tet family MFS transporter [Parasediminibacterium sp. JCM 36343]|uniref:TCR/Tet family MFS transporter n=1 Tax=Parasediminibacterium sp. JCM 36343 TaxID=3374279 RepID=UPI003979ED6E